MNDGALRAALEELGPDVPNDADAVLVDAKPRFRQARRRRRRRLGVAAGLAAAAGAVVLAAVLLSDPATTSSDPDPVSTNPPLTTGAPVPFTLDEIERG